MKVNQNELFARYNEPAGYERDKEKFLEAEQAGVLSRGEI